MSFGLINALVGAAADADPLRPKKVTFVVHTDGKGKGTEVKDLSKYLLNPTGLSFDRSAKWEAQKTGDSTSPAYTFSGGEETMVVDLLLDAAEMEGDLHDPLKALYSLAGTRKVQDQNNKSLTRPPVVEFSWGAKFRFIGLVEKVAVKVTLFDPLGAAKRASAAVTLKGWAYPDDVKNPVDILQSHRPPEKNG